MGLFAAFRSENPSYLHLLATTFKVPLLFLLTLVVTYPSLYVVSALFESKLKHRETLRLLLATMATNLALLASLGPVTAFFTLSTDSYAFMVVLNVLFFACSGLVGLGFLRKALRTIFAAPEPVAQVSEESGEVRFTPASGTPAAARVFGFWILIYGAVGAQMGWILRPFIGDPNLPFQLFRGGRESNFFASFFKARGQLFQ